MTGRLSATGKNILARGRRLHLPPLSPSLPRAYTYLLLDPAELLNATWGAMLAAPDAVNTETLDGRVEQRAAQIQPTIFSAARDDAPLRPTPFTTYAARRASTPKSPAPTSSSHALIGLHGDAATQATTKETSPAVSSSRKSSSNSSRGLFADRSGKAAASSKNIHVAAPPEAFARQRFRQTTDTENRPAAPAFSETSPVVTETAAVSNSLPRPDEAGAATRRPTPLRIGAVQRSPANAAGPTGDNKSASARTSSTSSADASPLESERATSSVLHFAHSPSRLAAVLNANLASTAQAPGALAETKEAASSTTRDERPRVAREGTGAPEANAETTQARVDLPVEALIEELYERLHLDFLRTYGTSGG